MMKNFTITLLSVLSLAVACLGMAENMDTGFEAMSEAEVEKCMVF